MKRGFLDIGTGEGTILKIAMIRGWERVEATEISSEAVKFVENESYCKMRQGCLEDLALNENAYDAILMNHVLEHVKNPRTTLEKVSRLLSNQGVVRIEVPNIASLSCHYKNVQSRLHLKKSAWKHYATNHHFWFFTAATLKHSIESSNLTLLHLYTPSRQWGKMSMADNIHNFISKRYSVGKYIVAYAAKKI